MINWIWVAQVSIYSFQFDQIALHFDKINDFGESKLRHES